jgi:glycosyltransferase involved in cell wall biosynthesis
VIVSVSPYAPSSPAPHAGGAYVTAHLQRLAAELQVVALAPESDPGRLEPTGELTVRRWPVTAPASAAGRARAYAAYLTGGLRYGAVEHAGFIRSHEVAEVLAGASLIELQFNTGLGLIGYIRTVNPTAPITVVSHDLYFDGLASMARNVRSLHTRVQAAAVLLRAARQEPRLLGQTDLIMVFGSRDRQLIEARHIPAPVLEISPVMELPPAPLPRAGTDVLFVGALDRPQNHDAAMWLCRDIWPRVRARAAGAQLLIVGANPKPELVAQQSQDIVVTGFVEDLEPFYARCGVVVAPLLSGAGVKFKVVQGLAYGRPVVATSLALQGIPPAPPAIVTAVDDAVGFAEAIGDRLVQTPSPQADAAAREFVVGHYSFERSMQRVIAAYRELMAGRPALG